MQIGSIGLIKAIDKFDLSFEVRFSTYAVPMIAGEIKRFLRDDGMIKVSRSLKENCPEGLYGPGRLEKPPREGTGHAGALGGDRAFPARTSSWR